MGLYPLMQWERMNDDSVCEKDSQCHEQCDELIAMAKFGLDDILHQTLADNVYVNDHTQDLKVVLTMSQRWPKYQSSFE